MPGDGRGPGGFGAPGAAPGTTARTGDRDNGPPRTGAGRGGPGALLGSPHPQRRAHRPAAGGRRLLHLGRRRRRLQQRRRLPARGRGTPVMAVGGFNGTDPAPTLAQFQALVAARKIHYFVGGGAMGGRGRRQTPAAATTPPGSPHGSRQPSRPRLSAAPPSTTSPEQPRDRCRRSGRMHSSHTGRSQGRDSAAAEHERHEHRRRGARPAGCAGSGPHPAETGRVVLDVVVPVYNEETDLEPSVRRLHAHLAARLPVPLPDHDRRQRQHRRHPVDRAGAGRRARRR